MDIVNAVLSVGSTISNWFSILITKIVSFFTLIWNFVWYLFDIVKALFYWLTSLLSWVWKVFVNIIDLWFFSSVWNTFSQIASYIWGPVTVILSSLFLLVIFRIWIAFVFKIFRLNIDYHSLTSKNKTWEQHKK